MPLAYIKDFSGGVNLRNPEQIGPTELQDSLNVVARGGVYHHAPTWDALDAQIPSGKRVVCGVARQDGTSVIVLWSADNQYEYGILSADGSTLQGPNPEGEGDWPAAEGETEFPLVSLSDWVTTSAPTEPAPVHGVYTPSGTVLVCDRQGYWPIVIANFNRGERITRQRRLRFNDYLFTYTYPNQAIRLESYDIRYREPSDYRIGITNENRLFSTNLAAGEFSDWQSAIDGSASMTPTRQYISIATSQTFNNVDMRFSQPLPENFAAKIWFVDINGVVSFRDEDAVVTPTLRHNPQRIGLHFDWRDVYAQSSLKEYKGRAESNVGSGLIRAVVRLDNIPAEGVNLGSIDIQHTQYLRQVTNNVSPHLVTTHRGQLVLAFSNVVQFGRASRGALLRGWEPLNNQEYFTEGGTRITALHSHKNFLAAFLESSINAITGNSKNSWGRDKLVDFSGTVNQDSVASDLGYLAYEDTEGNLSMLLNNNDVRQVTRHCKGLLDSAQASGTAALHVLQDDSLVLVYHNADGDGNAFVVVPETLRDDMGGGLLLSLFPFDGPGAVDDDGNRPQITASWSTISRVPFIAADRFYRCNLNPSDEDVATREVRYTLPLHAGGPPSGYQVKRLVLDVSVDCPGQVTVTYAKYGDEDFTHTVNIGADEIRRVEGSLLTSVPYSISLISATVTCQGPRLLHSYSFEYEPTSPGSLTTQD